MIVNSGSLDPEAGGQTDYGKLAKALGQIMSAGINFSLPNINESDFGFKPDVQNDRILYGLKAMLGVGDAVISDIIEKRPYTSIKDFYNKVHPDRRTMISLIKGGAFDEMEARNFAMAWFLWSTCKKKERLTLQNMTALIKYNMLPEKNDRQILARRIYEFNRYLKSVCKYNPIAYKLDERAISFLTEIGEECLIVDLGGGALGFEVKVWDKIYQNWMDVFREWLASEREEILLRLNSQIFKEEWNKYAAGNYSSWEMEALCFYYHEHELAHVNGEGYGLVDFFRLPEEPEIDKTFFKNKKPIHMYKLHRIFGTCIAKDKVRSIVTLLTPTGVVNVKFRKEYFSIFDKQISEVAPDGTKKVLEKSWFNRGSMILVTGIRSEDMFVVKKYASTGGHQLYKIDKIEKNGGITLRNARAKGIIEDEEEQNI